MQHTDTLTLTTLVLYTLGLALIWNGLLLGTLLCLPLLVAMVRLHVEFQMSMRAHNRRFRTGWAQ